MQKQVVSFFLGATDQDTSRKGVKQGDLITAENVQQLHSGEYIPRGGFTAATQTYESVASITPDAFVSPDGATKIVRNSATDIAYVQGPVGGTWKARRGTPRLIAKNALRFPSTTSDTQIAPMIKQSGDFFVWLDDEQHFRYAKQDADGVRLQYISDPITVAGPKGAGPYNSTHVSSFCVVQQATFDASNLWVFWVDWTTNAGAQQNQDGVWALKIPLDLSSTSQVCVQPGNGGGYILTGITATYQSSALWLAQCGIFLHSGSLVAFRSGSAGDIYGYAQHFTYTSAGVAGTVYTYSVTSSSRSWTASGICALTSPGYSTTGSFCYAFWTMHASDSAKCSLHHVTVSTTTGTASGFVLDNVNLATTILPATLTTAHSFVGSVTGHEDASGSYVVASVRVSASCTAATGPWVDIGDNTADRIFTRCYRYLSAGGGTVSTLWEKRGAWLAHGVFRMADGNEYVITGWQDTDEVQMPYHLRRLLDGEIVAQFSYGEGAYPGGCGTLAKQLDGNIGDLQQPYLSKQTYSTTYPSIVLATTSANVAGTVDMAAVMFSRPDYQIPAAFRDMAVAPASIPTIVGGWQNVQEAGPLVYPDTIASYYGSGAT